MKDYLTQLYNYQVTYWMDHYTLATVLFWVCFTGFMLFVLKNVSRYFAGLFLSYINIGIEQRLQ